MDEWRKLDIPPICERMIGFSVPSDGEVLVLSTEGVHLLRLIEVVVQTNGDIDEQDIYDRDSGVAWYREKKYQIIGLHGGNPIMESPKGERLELDDKLERLIVMQNGQMVFSTKYKNFSGDWAAATFSPDGRYIVLGCPYDFDFLVFARESSV